MINLGHYSHYKMQDTKQAPQYKLKYKTDLDKATDPEERTKLLHQAQRHITDEQVNVFLFQLANAGIAKADLMGLWQHAPTQAADMTGVYWKN